MCVCVCVCVCVFQFLLMSLGKEEKCKFEQAVLRKKLSYTLCGGVVG